MLPAILIALGVAAVLMFTSSLAAALVALAGMLFCAFLVIAPPFWLALLLIMLIPFQSLINQLLGGRESSSRELFAVWKELLLAVGIFRAFRHNPNRRQIIASNRWLLLWVGALLLVYCVTFLRMPSVPAVFSVNLETRFVLVMLLFIFLDLNAKQTVTLLRAMIWSVGLLALYGLVQYAWDYDRLLPLASYAPNLLAEDIRRLYSYSLNPFDPAYGAMIAILVLASGAVRWPLRRAMYWYALIIPCLLLTYTRSAYLGLVSGVAVMCIFGWKFAKRLGAVSLAMACLVCALALFGDSAVWQSSVSQRIFSIRSQKDDSSVEHKRRMARAVDLIIANPSGIGLGKYGNIEARFTRGSGEVDYTENWVLQVGVQNGVVGAFVYLALTFTIFVMLLQGSQARKENAKPLRIAAAAAFVATTVAGVMIPVWDFLLPTVYAWGLVGMALGRCHTPVRLGKGLQSHTPSAPPDIQGAETRYP